MSAQPELHGVAAEFASPNELLNATKLARKQGYTSMEAYTPFPVDGLADQLGFNRTAVPLIVLIGGIAGALGGYFMEWYAMAVSYPINVGGRPFDSWPAYIPITFELLVLTASIFAVVGMLALNRLPRPNHPVFNVPGFERATTDRFFLCIESHDPLFDESKTSEFLQSLNPLAVNEVRS